MTHTKEREHCGRTAWGAPMALAVSLGVAGVGRASPLPLGTPEHQGVSADRLRRIDTRFAAGVAKGEIPGAVVMVARHGRLIYDRAIGYADRANQTPMTDTTVFPLASMTKPLTTVAAMTLVEQGKLSLSDPISKYLPAFKTLKVQVVRTGPDGQSRVELEPLRREPTVQDLMRHTAGFVYGVFGDSAVDKAYLSNDVIDLDAPLSTMVDRLSKLPLAHQPGDTFEYSVAVDVLGRIVEVVSGEPLDQYIKDSITGPLGLTSIDFHVAPGARVAWADATSAADRAVALKRTYTNPALLSGGGGLYGDAGDYLRFCQMLLNGGELDGVRILSPKTVQMMTSDQLAPSTDVAPNIVKLLGSMAPTAEMGQGFGLGFAVRLSAGRNPLPGSVGEFYWAGAWGTYFWVDSAENLITIMLTNQRDPDAKALYRNLSRQLVYQALDVVAPLPTPVDVRGLGPARSSAPAADVGVPPGLTP